MIDEPSFEFLVRANLRKWQSAALRITGNCADADDAVQSALVCTWEKRDTFSDGPRLCAFIYGTVIHKAVDLVRSDTARHRREKNWQTPDPRPKHRELYQAIAKLPETYAKTVIVLLENEMKYADAALELGWTEKLLYSRMHRAKLRLTALLKNQEPEKCTITTAQGREKQKK